MAVLQIPSFSNSFRTTTFSPSLIIRPEGQELIQFQAKISALSLTDHYWSSLSSTKANRHQRSCWLLMQYPKSSFSTYHSWNRTSLQMWEQNTKESEQRRWEWWTTWELSDWESSAHCTHTGSVLGLALLLSNTVFLYWFSVLHL